MKVESTDTQEMVRVAQQMLSRAHCPYSNYKVGACVMAEDGTLFGGCNVENAAYGATICAEASAICAMVAAGKKKIVALVVMSSGAMAGSPCGNCRQIIREFGGATTPLYLCNNKGEICKVVTIDELLPMSFGLEYIG